MQAAVEEITTTAILKSDSRNIKSPDNLSGLFYDTYFLKSNYQNLAGVPGIKK
jgi:hypothetical protein